MANLNGLGKLAFVLVIVGALNWGLVGINSDWNLVKNLLGAWEMVERAVYVLVGISALVLAFGLGKKGGVSSM